MDKLTINVDELARILGISRPVAYQLIKTKGFPAIRVGQRRILIPIDSLQNWLSTEAGNSYEEKNI